MNLEKPQSMKEKYLSKIDKDGFVLVSDFCWAELHRQCKSIASFLDGDGGTNPDCNLGKNLNYEGDSGNYSAMKIHIDNLEEFIQRVKSYYNEI